MLSSDDTHFLDSFPVSKSRPVKLTVFHPVSSHLFCEWLQFSADEGHPGGEGHRHSSSSTPILKEARGWNGTANLTIYGGGGGGGHNSFNGSNVDENVNHHPCFLRLGVWNQVGRSGPRSQIRGGTWGNKKIWLEAHVGSSVSHTSQPKEAGASRMLEGRTVITMIVIVMCLCML